MLLLHCGEFRHATVVLQQLPTTHWLHGVPPGSSEQAPASLTGLPQSPLKHVSPMQHCAGESQLDPCARQAPEPHWPFSLHSPEQHSSVELHENPSTLHCVAPQVPSLQKPVQHSKLCVQPKPSGLHC